MVVAFYQAIIAMLRSLTMTTMSLTDIMQFVWNAAVHQVSPAARAAWERSVGSVLLLLLGCSFWAVMAGSGGLWAQRQDGGGHGAEGVEEALLGVDDGGGGGGGGDDDDDEVRVVSVLYVHAQPIHCRIENTTTRSPHACINNCILTILTLTMYSVSHTNQTLLFLPLGG